MNNFANFDRSQIFPSIKLKFPNASFCFFHGSMLTRTENQLSDVDVIVVTSDTCQPFREEFIVEKRVYDAFIFDAESLNGAMHGLHRNCSGALAYGVANGVVLPQANAVSTKLANLAKRLCARPMVASQSLLTLRRHSLTKVMDDLPYAKSPSERTLLAIDAAKNIVEVRLLADGKGMNSAKYSARLFFARWPEQFAQIELALQNAFAGEPEVLIALCNQALLQIGGPLRGTLRMDLPNSLRLSLPP